MEFFFCWLILIYTMKTKGAYSIMQKLTKAQKDLVKKLASSCLPVEKRKAVLDKIKETIVSRESTERKQVKV